MFLSRSAGVPVLDRPAEAGDCPARGNAAEADEEQLQAVLLHEMAHIARRDHWVGVGQRIAAVLFWWNPLVHWACDEISDLREEICDNYVVLVQGEGQRLARILVDLAARVAMGPLLPSTIGVLEPRLAGLTGRVTRLLDKERNMETRMNLRSKVFVFAGGLAVLTGMATIGGLRLAYAQPAKETKPAAAGQPVTPAPGARQGAIAPAKGPKRLPRRLGRKTRTGNRRPRGGSCRKGDRRTDVGVQAWPFNREGLPASPFLAVARTDAGGRFRLLVPQVHDLRRLEAAVWAVADGCQPAASNSWGSLTGTYHGRNNSETCSRRGAAVLRIVDRERETGFRGPHDCRSTNC